MATYGSPSALTIVGGAITVSGSGLYTVATEADASTDDLDTINGTSDGDVVLLMADDATQTVRVRHNTGNIHLAGGISFSLNDAPDMVQVVDIGTVLIGFGLHVPGTLVGGDVIRTLLTTMVGR